MFGRKKTPEEIRARQIQRMTPQKRLAGLRAGTITPAEIRAQQIREMTPRQRVAALKAGKIKPEEVLSSKQLAEAQVQAQLTVEARRPPTPVKLTAAPKPALSTEQERAFSVLREMARTMPDANGVVAPDDFYKFFQFLMDHKVDLKDHAKDIRDPMFLGLAKGGYFLRVPTSAILNDGEMAIFEDRVALLNKNDDQVDYGDLILTDLRLLYQSDQKNLDIPVEKIVRVSGYNWSVHISVKGRANNIGFGNVRADYFIGIVNALHAAGENAHIINPSVVDPETGEITSPN